MTIEDLKSRIEEMCTHILFQYNGQNCGIDPKTLTRFDIWYGSEAFTAKSIENVMNLRFFDGKSLSEIIDKATFIEE